MQSKVTHIAEPVKPKVYYCWNAKSHPKDYSELMFENTAKSNEIVVCPVCGQAHKITQRL